MKIAVVGATGLVGSKILQVLEERNFPVTELIPVASQKSIGKEISFKEKQYKVVSYQDAIAAKPKPVTPNPSATSTKPGDGKPYKDGPLWDSYQYDAYDLVLEYLLSQGHAETVAEAQYLMIEMDSEMIGEIVEGIADRTANAVGHQRAGTLGDADEMRKNQDATSASIGKMKRGSGAKVTPTLPGV